MERPNLFMIPASLNVLLLRVGTEKAAADLGAVIIDAATPIGQKFTAVVDFQLVRAVERQLQALGSQCFKALIFIPADYNGGKGAAADAAALTAAVIAVAG
jgi:hypothetical protein